MPESLLDVPVPGAATADDPHAALDDLANYSLATRDPETETFLLHRLIQDVTRRGLAQAGTESRRLTEALGWMDAAFTGDPQDVRTWKVLDPLAPHAEAVAGHADAAGIAEPTVDVMSRLGMLFRCKGAAPTRRTIDPAARSPSPRRTSSQTTPVSRSASTTSPSCCKPPTGSARRNR